MMGGKRIVSASLLKKGIALCYQRNSICFSLFTEDLDKIGHTMKPSLKVNANKLAKPLSSQTEIKTCHIYIFSFFVSPPYI